jgi:hypothetical protein
LRLSTTYVVQANLDPVHDDDDDDGYDGSAPSVTAA